ncbi:MAG: hypothetical protein M3332_17645, partial [Actinomycetota bacterium]|nr:hypothetical protein [Actinomycetota bacterium]
LKVADPTERKVRALVEIGPATTDALRTLIPSSWVNEEIVSWFLRVVPTPPPERGTIRMRKLKLFGDYKWKYVSGWTFVQDAPVPPGLRVFSSTVLDPPKTVAILPDGRFFWFSSWSNPADDELMSVATLKQIFAETKLPRLDLPPRPRATP